MNRYQIITSQEQTIISLMGIGIIPVQFLDWKVYYEEYLQQLEDLEKENTKALKGEAMGYVAIKYNLSERQVQRVVKWMESL